MCVRVCVCVCCIWREAKLATQNGPIQGKYVQRTEREREEEEEEEATRRGSVCFV